MKRVLVMLIFLSLAFVSRAQTTVLEKVWATSQSEEGLEEMNARVDRLVTALERRHYRSDYHKLYALFMKTQSRFLHNYVQYTGIENLSSGRYDCLTATSLFADILNKSGFRYNIIETNYHIFIVVNTSKGDVILETTDRLGGFIDNEKKANAVISKYKKNLLASASPTHYEYTFSLYRQVSTDQLVGLLYFNQAVNAFNGKRWNECSEKLTAAKQTTDSPRIVELLSLLDNSTF